MRGVSVQMRESNPRALPSRRQEPANRHATSWAVAALALAISCAATDSRSAVLLQIHRPVRVLNLDIKLAAIPGELIDSSAHRSHVKRTNQPDLRTAVARLLLGGRIRDRFERSVRSPSTSRRASASVSVLPDDIRVTALVRLIAAMSFSNSTAIASSSVSSGSGPRPADRPPGPAHSPVADREPHPVAPATPPDAPAPLPASLASTQIYMPTSGHGSISLRERRRNQPSRTDARPGGGLGNPSRVTF